MQKEYKSAVEQISLSDDDRARILANVKKAAINPGSSVEELHTDAFRKRPVFSLRNMGTAAACIILCIGGLFIYKGITGKDEGVGGNIEGGVITYDPAEEVVWEELGSIKEIGEKTDCKTFTLSNVPRKYRLKKIEVANEQRRVRLTYRNKKEHDKILFEYKEAEDAPELMSQFETEKTLSKETVGDADVTMYGEEKCDGMVWKKSSCTFAVRMTKARSKKAAKELVSGAAEGMENARDEDKKTTVDRPGSGGDGQVKAVGWSGGVRPSTPAERKRILKRVYELLGFRVTIIPPAENVAYKLIEEHESFAFQYPQREELSGKWLVGYVGLEGCPDGVMEGFWEVETVAADQTTAEVYENKDGDKLFCFQKQGAAFTLFVPKLETTEYEQILGELISVVRISRDDGISDDEDDPEKTERPDNTSGEDDENESENKSPVAEYREMALKIQDAVSDKSLQRLVFYMDFPLVVDNQGTVAGSQGELASLMGDGRLFTSVWVDAVVSFDVNQIQPSTKSFVMGSESNGLRCKIRGGSIVITEIYSDVIFGEHEEAKATPLEE